MSEQPPTTAEVAAGFTALLRVGDFRAATETYWADEVVSIEPGDRPDGPDQVSRGIEAVRARGLGWCITHGIEDLSLDGPFVTGDQFALFVDMLIVHAGRRTAHSEIVVFAVRNGKIVEERHFHE